MAEDAEALSGSLALFSDLTRVLLQDVRREAAASLEALVPHKITTLFGLITAGADLYRSLGVKTKSEAEAVWQKSDHHAAVRQQLDELLQLEGEWDSFLKQVDDGLQASDGLLSAGEPLERLNPHSQLCDARSGRSTTLGEFLCPGQKLLLVLIRHFG
ncbi:selenoprotein L isoform 1-T3 [Menidia menidia]